MRLHSRHGHGLLAAQDSGGRAEQAAGRRGPAAGEGGRLGCHLRQRQGTRESRVRPGPGTPSTPGGAPLRLAAGGQMALGPTGADTGAQPSPTASRTRRCWKALQIDENKQTDRTHIAVSLFSPGFPPELSASKINTDTFPENIFQITTDSVKVCPDSFKTVCETLSTAVTSASFQTHTRTYAAQMSQLPPPARRHR